MAPSHARASRYPSRKGHFRSRLLTTATGGVDDRLKDAARIELRSLAADGVWVLNRCLTPSSLAIDADDRRTFAVWLQDCQLAAASCSPDMLDRLKVTPSR